MGLSPPSPDIHALRLGTNAVYAVREIAGCTLVDAGPDYEGSWDELVAQLAAIGTQPRDVRTVVLTHSHLDHAGLAARWQEQGAHILIGRADAPSLTMDDAARQHERALARSTLLRHGVPPEALDLAAGQSDRYTRWPASLQMTPLQPDGLLDDGDILCPDERPLRVVACPGHTPGTVMLVDDNTGTVFTGDHILPRMAPSVGIQFDGEQRRPSLPSYLASLRHAGALAGPSRVAYPGHGEPISDLGGAADWTIRLLEQRARRVLAQLRHGPATAYALARRMFPHLRARHLRAAMAETIGLLDLLAERGQAAADEGTERVLWSATGMVTP